MFLEQCFYTTRSAGVLVYTCYRKSNLWVVLNIVTTGYTSGGVYSSIMVPLGVNNRGGGLEGEQHNMGSGGGV